MERQRRFTSVGQAVAVCGMLALFLAGCSTGDPQPQAPTTTDSGNAQLQTPESSGSETSAQAFVDAFETEGLECAPADAARWGPGVVEQVNCQGADSVIVTIRNFEDTDARDGQLARVQDQACKIAESGQEIQRLATSDTWIVMVGGDREVDFEVFGNATTTLGLDWTDYTC